MAKLYFRYGAMGSSKSANAIMVRHNYAERGKQALMLKPKLDSRDGEKIVASRSGLSAPCEYVENLDSIDVSRYDCLIIDEAQFLDKSQIIKLMHIVDDLNVPVICYGLRADFQGNLFEGSKWLLAWADSIEELKTVCWCGHKATCNTRVSRGRVVREGEQIMLGGNESYVALCRRHWSNGDLGPGVARYVSGDRSVFMPLFMTADAEKQAVMKYYYNGELYAVYGDDGPISELLLTKREDGQYEVKSLATREDAQGRGLAGTLIKLAKEIAHCEGKKLYVGTDPATASFYEHFGFQYEYTVKDFFITNYEHPVIDRGVVLKDMVYLSVSAEQSVGSAAVSPMCSE